MDWFALTALLAVAHLVGQLATKSEIRSSNPSPVLGLSVGHTLLTLQVVYLLINLSHYFRRVSSLSAKYGILRPSISSGDKLKVFGLALCLSAFVVSIDTVLSVKCLKSSVTRTPFSIKAYHDVYEKWRESMLYYSSQQRWPKNPRDLYYSIAPSGPAGCGLSYPDFLAIVGGKKAPLRAWPWYVTYVTRTNGGNKGDYCGGTLLSNEWALTAAHCLRGKLSTILFDYRRQSKKIWGHKKSILVAKEIPHPMYKNISGASYFDIALLKLRKPVVFTNNIQPACLPDDLIDLTSPFLDCYIAGYGLKQAKPAVIVPKNLQELKVETMDYRECGHYWKLKIVNHQICLRHKVNAGICHLDSGAPLSCIGPGGAFFVAGVAAWNAANCTDKISRPDVFMSTLYFKPWIKKTILKDSGRLPPVFGTNP
ncbi:chymotrypsin-like elastase family member 2a [Plakobranchus ocellatus]|uniref:Chymotrypsin-like elastase family member 2a n=1 Tax=Plakobranchus ocellatus TaxID=259542 RepID=A0AAV4CN81_9GAST|nr:chymotrypsin-like elastase family member 2a [Plakobranchus ocellatus]